MKRNDWILIIFIIVVVCFCFLLFIPKKQVGNEIVIIKSGEEWKRLSLTANTSIEITGENGEKNKLEIKDGYANITEANCPDKLCIKQKKIKYSGEQLVCLPHKLIVKVTGTIKSDLDSIAQLKNIFILSIISLVR